MTREDVRDLVKKRLDRVGHGIEFEIVEDGMRQEESWWYVPVIATRRGKDVPRETTVNLYANVEDELEENHGVSVLFVPVVSETAGD